MSELKLDLTGRVALVTGGTRGIGLAIAESLQGAGAEVTVVGRSIPSGLPFRAEACDVRDRKQLEGLRQRFESLDILVANAGMNKRAEALDLDDPSLRDIIETNLYGAFITCQTFGPLLLSAPSGRCIVTSSFAGIHGQKLRAAYCGVKAGLNGAVRALAVEWGPQGCTVNAIAPGFIRTPLTETYMNANPDRVAAAIDHTPMRRLGEPGDVASVVAFLASDLAGFITGQVIYVDGGVTAGSDWW